MNDSATPNSQRIVVPGQAPFVPRILFLATLLGGLAVGGFLAALNWDRLGQEARKWPTFFGALAASLAVGVVAVLLVALTGNGLALLGILPFNAAGGVALARWQAGPIRAWVAAHGPPTVAHINPGGVLWALLLLAFAQTCLLLPFLNLTVLPALIPLLPEQTFSGGGLALRYSRAWERLDLSDDPLCQQPGTTCLLGLRHTGSALILDVVRLDAPQADAESAAAALWQEVQAGAEDAALIEQGATRIGGQPAYQLLYSQENPFPRVPGERLYLRRILARHSGALYRFTAMGVDPAALEGDIGGLRDILDSVRFTD